MEKLEQGACLTVTAQQAKTSRQGKETPTRFRCHYILHKGRTRRNTNGSEWIGWEQETSESARRTWWSKRWRTRLLGLLWRTNNLLAKASYSMQRYICSVARGVVYHIIQWVFLVSNMNTSTRFISKNSQLVLFLIHLHHQYPQSPRVILHPFMPPVLPSTTTSTNMTSAGGMPSSGLSSTSQAPSNNPGSIVANSSYLSHIRGEQIESFTGQQGLLTDPSHLGAGISPTYAPAGASSTGDASALNNSSLGGADNMMALL